jgi:hypothetical protein
MATIGNSCFWLADLKKSASLKPLGHMNRNLVGSIYGRKWAIFIENLSWMLPTKFQFIWQSSFRGEHFLEINQSETRSIYGRSSIKIAHFVPIRYQTWPPQTILVSDWLISKKSSPL